MPRRWFNREQLASRPSWVVVLVAGSLLVFFLFASGREVIRWYNVRKQVRRLAQTVAVEQQRQQQLQDLIDYLGSPTYQEREARLKLGLKKPGERVILVPPGPEESGNASTTPSDGAVNNGGQSSAEPATPPARWWRYFFGPQTSSTNS